MRGDAGAGGRPPVSGVVGGDLRSAVCVAADSFARNLAEPAEDGQFQIEPFELVNLIVGGLFAVIALNFTINSIYQVLGSGDNPVNRLFTLNYVTLGVSLLVNILIFRFGVVERVFGRYVQEQLYLFLIWAIPCSR